MTDEEKRVAYHRDVGAWPPPLSDTPRTAPRGALQGDYSPQERFIEWFLYNYPPNCVLANPSWHAPKIWRASARGLEQERDRLHSLLFEWHEAFHNRDETTSLKTWNDRMKEVDQKTRLVLEPNAAPQAATDKETLNLIDQRDAAEEAVSEMYFRITGKSPEWSNLFGFNEAIEEITEAFDTVRAAAKDRASAIVARERKS